MANKTASDIKARYQELNPNGHFFDRKTLKFFGDTMSNFGVTTTINPNEYHMFRRKAVKHNLLGDGWVFNWETGALRSFK